MRAAQVGDRIVSINGQSVDGLSHGEVVTVLKNSYGNISLQVTQLIQLPLLHQQVESFSRTLLLSFPSPL